MACQYSLTTITVLIGAFVAFTGWQQYKINKERFKLDLFEKRFAVYKGAGFPHGRTARSKNLYENRPSCR